jgi:hypothetical protein
MLLNSRTRIRPRQPLTHFGLAGWPSSYARLVHMVLDGIPYTQALPYLDDTVIHSKDLDGHFVTLYRVLEAYAKAGLKLQPAKCQLFNKEIEYLGHMVSAKGIAPVPGYVQVVKDWPMPTNRTEVRTFLGKTGYYRSFMKNYAEIAGPLTDLLKQDNKERVIAYGASKLTVAQSAYHSTKGEMAAAIIYIRKWKYYLQHRRYILRIDNAAMQWIHTLVEPVQGMVQR